MTGEGSRRIGTTFAASHKGMFGAVEFIFGIDTTMVIKDIDVRRSRERDTRSEERAFLELFTEKRRTARPVLHSSTKEKKNTAPGP
jgi:hypothetical protein